MGKVTVRWQDFDRDGMSITRERVLKGENIGYDLGSVGDLFLRAWADEETFIVYDNRVIYVHVEK